MRNHSTTTPADVQALIESANQGKIDPMKFCAALEARGISGAEQLPYLLKGFEMKFEDAKKILIEQRYGSVDAWAEEMGEIVDELPREDVGSEQ